MKGIFMWFVIVLMVFGLLFSGYSFYETKRLTAQIDVLQSQKLELEEEAANKDKIITGLEKEVESLQEENESLKIAGQTTNQTVNQTASIEIRFEPDPVLPTNGRWQWKIVMSEKNGVGFTIQKTTFMLYGPNNELVKKDEKGPGGSIPQHMEAYSLVRLGAGLSAQPGVSYSVFVVIGVDDNGHQIEAKGSVNLIQ